jgi:hypothetical protein
MQITKERLAKEFGRQAFGENPASYHVARPEYPGWVYDTLTSRCGLRHNAAVFEIGAGTGTATHRLLELGADPLVAIEPDQRLADFLRANNPDKALKVVAVPFEDAALEAAAFDLGVSATAFSLAQRRIRPREDRKSASPRMPCGSSPPTQRLSAFSWAARWRPVAPMRGRILICGLS